MKNKTFYIIVGVVILLAVAGFVFARRQKTDLEKEAEQNIDKDDLTYNNAEYSSLAERIYAAMNGVATDENTIVEIVKKMKTASDWYKLVTKFGTRKTTSWFSSFSGNLVEWITDEIEGFYLNEVKQHLSGLGVTI